MRAGANTFGILASPLEHESLPSLGDAVRPHAAGLAPAELENLRELVYPDVFSEYDARHLSAFVRTLDVPLSDHFRACEVHWARDEELHYLGFRAVYGAMTGRSEAELAAEMAAREDEVLFGPVAHLFADELSIACLMTYDELATVRAYRSGFPRYARLGPEAFAFVRTVTADEGRHFRNFLKLIREEHGERLDEVPRIVERIRETEVTSYGNTFVLDHDDDVWSEEIFDGAARTLCNHLSA